MIENIDGLLVHVYKEISNFTDVAVIGLFGGADSILVSILGKDSVCELHMPCGILDENTFDYISYCVKYTVMDALSLGYRTSLIEDGCRGANISSGDSEKVIEDMKQSGALIDKSYGVSL